MRAVFIIIFLSASVWTCEAQQIKPYQVIVKTLNAKKKGVLYKVDSAWLAVEGKDGFTKIKSHEIRSIKVTSVKKNYKIKKFVKYDPWDVRHFDANVNTVPTSKWGEKDPSVKEEINGHIGTSMISVLVNLIAAPIHAINPGIARIRFNDRIKFADQVNTLRFYSIHYQANRDELKELKQIRLIGEAFELRSHQ